MSMNENHSGLLGRVANLSFVCMCLVVFIHVHTSGLIAHSIYEFSCLLMKGALGEVAVPWFFLVSGYFFGAARFVGGLVDERCL